MSQHTVTEADLHAYVDGFLSEARQREVELYLCLLYTSDAADE